MTQYCKDNSTRKVRDSTGRGHPDSAVHGQDRPRQARPCGVGATAPRTARKPWEKAPPLKLADHLEFSLTNKFHPIYTALALPTRHCHEAGRSSNPRLQPAIAIQVGLLITLVHTRMGLLTSEAVSPLCSAPTDLAANQQAFCSVYLFRLLPDTAMQLYVNPRMDFAALDPSRRLRLASPPSRIVNDCPSGHPHRRLRRHESSVRIPTTAVSPDSVPITAATLLLSST